MRESLDPRRLDLLRRLAQWSAAAEEIPTQREIARALGYSSDGSVPYHLAQLERAGYIERGKAPSRKKRRARLTEKGWEAVGEGPMLGRVAAGRGLEAIAFGDEAYSLVAQLLMPKADGRSRYLLRVTGQSMTGAWIGDGSLLIVEQDEDPPDGEVVVALLGGGEEVTVKRLFREGENVRLRAENGDHTDIVAPTEDVLVQGRVVSVIQPPKR